MTQPKGAIVFKILVTAIFTVIGGVILGSVIACAVGLICKSGGGGGGGGGSPVTLASDQCLSAANACGQSTIGTYVYTCPTEPQGSPISWTLTPPCSGDSCSIIIGTANSTCYEQHTGSTDEGTYYVVDGNGSYVTKPSTKSCNATAPDSSSCPAVTIDANGFYATPSTVGLNGKTTLHWTSNNSDGCTIAGDNGYSYSGGPAGSVDVTGLTQTVTYTLTCSAGAGGTSATKSIRVIVDPHYKEL